MIFRLIKMHFHWPLRSPPKLILEEVNNESEPEQKRRSFSDRVKRMVHVEKKVRVVNFPGYIFMLTIAGANGERTVDGDAGKGRLREIWKSFQTCF